MASDSCAKDLFWAPCLACQMEWKSGAKNATLCELCFCFCRLCNYPKLVVLTLSQIDGNMLNLLARYLCISVTNRHCIHTCLKTQIRICVFIMSNLLSWHIMCLHVTVIGKLGSNQVWTSQSHTDFDLIYWLDSLSSFENDALGLYGVTVLHMRVKISSASHYRLDYRPEVKIDAHSNSTKCSGSSSGAILSPIINIW